MDLEWLAVFALLGTVVGFMAGLLGVGGGGIMVPTLTAIFIAQGVAPEKVVHLALGTSMAAIVFTSFASLRAHHKNNGIVWPLVGKMAGGVVFGTFAATFVAAYLNSTYLAMFFAAFMSYVAVNMFIKKPVASHLQSSSAQITTQSLIATSTGIGTVSALVSIGGGALTVPYLSNKGIELKKAIGTSAAVGLPISLAGTLGYLINGWQVNYEQSWVLGFIYLPAVLIIAFTSYFTAPIGARLAHRMPVAILKKVFSVLLVILALKMLSSVVSF